MPNPTNSSGQDMRYGIRTDFIWVMVVLAGFLFFTSLVPLAPNDYWWHLRIGQVISSEHAIPETNIYSWSIPQDQPFFYGAWLGEWLLYVNYQLGELPLSIFTRNLIVGITFFLVAKEAHRRTGSWRIASLVLALACLMCTNNMLLRPQMWALIPFVILYILLSRYQDGQLRGYWLGVCPTLMAFWVNVHGSFVLGLGLMGIYCVGEALNYLLKRREATAMARLIWLTAISGLSALFVLINPKTYHIYAYVIKLLTDPSSQNLIEEWQSPSPDGLANTTFFLSIILLIAVLAFSKHKINPTQLLSLGAFLWLAWSGQRYVLWYAIMAMPLFAQLLSQLQLRLLNLEASRNWFNVLLLMVIFIPVMMVQPWLVESFPLPITYWAQVQNDPEIGPLLSVNTPINAARYLQENPGGNLFNEMGYGSYLIWALPDQKIFVDPRVELYPLALWEQYIDISNGVRSLELLNAYGVDRVMLDTTLQPELSAVLEMSPTWSLEYQDANTEIWKLTPSAIR